MKIDNILIYYTQYSLTFMWHFAPQIAGFKVVSKYSWKIQGASAVSTSLSGKIAF